MAFVAAYNVRNEKVSIPEHWLNHPVLGRGFTKHPHKQAAKSADESRSKGRKATHEAPATGDDEKE